MKSRTQLNLALALSLTGLILFAIFEPGKDTTPSSKNTLTNLNPEAIQKFQLQFPEKPAIHFKKMGGHWQMLEPFSALANQHRLTQLLDIVSSTSLSSYPVIHTDSHQLKLDRPWLKLILNNIQLELGGTAALGGSRYVRINNTVHLITDRYSHLAQGPATNLLSPALLSTTTKITALRLPHFELSLQNGRWQLQGANTNTNPDQLQQFLDEWTHARAFDVQTIDVKLKSTEIIVLNTEGSSLTFTVQQTEDEIILQRHDLGLQYHFSLETGQRLITLPLPNDA